MVGRRSLCRHLRSKTSSAKPNISMHEMERSAEISWANSACGKSEDWAALRLAKSPLKVKGIITKVTIRKTQPVIIPVASGTEKKLDVTYYLNYIYDTKRILPIKTNLWHHLVWGLVRPLSSCWGLCRKGLLWWTLSWAWEWSGELERSRRPTRPLATPRPATWRHGGQKSLIS